MKKGKIITAVIATGVLVFFSATIIVVEKILKVSKELSNNHGYDYDDDDYIET